MSVAPFFTSGIAENLLFLCKTYAPQKANPTATICAKRSAGSRAKIGPDTKIKISDIVCMIMSANDK